MVEWGGKLVWTADEKASLFLAHFDAKQSRDSFQLPHSCDPSPVLCSVTFRSSFCTQFALDLDPYCGSNLDGMFSLFYKQVAREQAPKLAEIFRPQVKGGSFGMLEVSRCCSCAKGISFLGSWRL